MEQPNNQENHGESQERPAYYGTGRRRELDKSRLPLIVSLLAVVLAANLLTIALHVANQQEETAQSETEDAAFDAYPARSPMQANAENESTSFGMALSALDEAERRYWELPEGVIVRSVDAGSVAAKTGVLPGDILLSVGGTAVKDASDYFAVIEAAKPGDTIKLTVYRCGTYYVLELTIPANEQTVCLES